MNLTTAFYAIRINSSLAALTQHGKAKQCSSRHRRLLGNLCGQALHEVQYIAELLKLAITDLFGITKQHSMFSSNVYYHS